MRLYLCEKPSQGKDIAKVLGATRRGEGCLSGMDTTVTWCIGHLLEAAPPKAYGEQYKHWSLKQLPIIPTQWKLEVKPKTAKQLRVIQRLLGEADSVVIATDADREGEMIAREILERCRYCGPVQRLWLSALNEASIRQALASLKPGAETLPLYHSALARSRADWLVGINLSRLFTLLGRRAGYAGVLPVGRVQTPTLRLVVERDRAIAAFVPTPYWEVEVQLSAEGHVFSARWLPQDQAADGAGRCIQHTAAKQAEQAMHAAETASVLSLDTEHVCEAAPLPFDLGTLQDMCSRRFGLGAQQTLDIAQSLYETHKATTYPRSDCGYLPDSMFAEVPLVLAALAKTDPLLDPVLQPLDYSIRSRAWNDAKVTAHHGIIPTTAPVDISHLSDRERAVYQLVRAHYLAQFLPHHEFDRTAAHLECAAHRLRAVGKQVRVRGWKGLIDEPKGDDPVEKSQVLPALREGARCPVQGVELKNRRTAPPKPFTEGDLVKAMKQVAKWVDDPRLVQKLKETAGIGTEATRAAIIKGLIDHGYLLKKHRALSASAAAHTLIEAVPKAVADPGMTAIWEQALDEIEAGRLSLETFVTKQAHWVTQLVERGAALTVAVPVEAGPTCPICKAPMHKRRGKSGPFWSCSQYPACHGLLAIESPSRRKRSAKPR